MVTVKAGGGGEDAMTKDLSIKVMLALCTTIALIGAAYAARSILMPVAFALFIAAIVWPLHSALEMRLPTLVALAITIVCAALVIILMAILVAWGFGVVGQWLFRNAARLQELYGQIANWLDAHGIHATGLITEYFDVNWMLRAFQQVSGRLHGVATFWITTLVFLLLALLEVRVTKQKLDALDNRDLGRALVGAAASTATKFRHYMLIRTLMSLATGLAVWVFSLLAGLELATAWGVIAFGLNYIPFIGPFIATIFPSLFATAQLESWQMALFVFMCLNLIQFLIGSYVEPRVAGAAVAISPFVILFAVFFGLFLWGIPGAFIGVPVLIAGLTVCQQFESSRWVADLLSGGAEPKKVT